jgi:hypothetical protein
LVLLRQTSSQEITMLALLRRRREAVLAGTVFCDGCAEVCTAGCRADAHRDRVRTAALALGVGIR